MVIFANKYTFSLSSNMPLLVIAIIVCSHVCENIFCVFLKYFKCEVNRCVGVLNGLVLCHLSTPNLLKNSKFFYPHPWNPVPLLTSCTCETSQVLFFKTWQHCRYIEHRRFALIHRYMDV